MNTPLLEEALRVASAEKFSAARFRQLKSLYDQADTAEQPQVKELVEVFLVLAETDEDFEAVNDIWPA
jgi:hypothetical protein